MAGKARDGTGSFRRRGDGWECELSVGAREERRRYRGYGRTQDQAYDDAHEQMVEAQRQANVEQAVGRRVATLAEFFEWWLEVECRNRVDDGTLAETTRLFYEKLYRRSIKSRLGHIPLADMNRRADDTGRQSGRALIKSLLAELRQEGASKDMRKKVHQTLQAGLSAAVREDLLEYNPAAGMRVPAVKRARKDEVPLAHAQALLEAAQGHRFEALYRLALHIPMRPGELTGIEWDALKLDESRLIVRRNLVYVNKHGWRLHDTKAHQERPVPLPASVVRLLRAWRARQAEERLAAGPTWFVLEAWEQDEDDEWRLRPPDLVFTQPETPRNPAGRPVRQYWLQKDLAQLCERAGIPVMNPHRLRHAAKTLLTSQGLDPHVVQQMGGWSDLATADLYTGVLMAKMREAVDQLAEELERPAL